MGPALQDGAVGSARGVAVVEFDGGGGAHLWRDGELGVFDERNEGEGCCLYR